MKIRILRVEPGEIPKEVVGSTAELIGYDIFKVKTGRQAQLRLRSRYNSKEFVVVRGYTTVENIINNPNCQIRVKHYES